MHWWIVCSLSHFFCSFPSQLPLFIMIYICVCACVWTHTLEKLQRQKKYQCSCLSLEYLSILQRALVLRNTIWKMLAFLIRAYTVAKGSIFKLIDVTKFTGKIQEHLKWTKCRNDSKVSAGLTVIYPHV